MIISIREAVPADAPALVALERAAPETTSLAIRLELKIDHFALTARYPGVRGYVALEPGSAAIVGVLFASVAPTQLNGQLVPGVYLFNLRVHPSYRRRGVASALVAHAWQTARAEFHVEVGWAAIVSGNDASRRTFHRAGFAQERDLGMRLVVPGLAPGRAPPDLVFRPAEPDDLPPLSVALNAHYTRHQFWRPLTGDRLAFELGTLHHSSADVLLGLAPDGALVAAASAFVLGRVADLRLLGLRALPDALNRLLAPVFRLVPVRPLLVRHPLLPADRPLASTALLRRLHRRYLPEAPVIAMILDPLDPTYPVVSRLPGVSSRIHVVARSEGPVDVASPWYLV